MFSIFFIFEKPLQPTFPISFFVVVKMSCMSRTEQLMGLKIFFENTKKMCKK